MPLPIAIQISPEADWSVMEVMGATDRGHPEMGADQPATEGGSEHKKENGQGSGESCLAGMAGRPAAQLDAPERLLRVANRRPLP